METMRFILLISFGLVSMLLWQAWQEDYGQQPAPIPEITAAKDNETPAITANDPVSVVAEGLPETNVVQNEAEPAPATVITEQSYITVETDLYIVKISNQGGNIVDLALKKYPINKKIPDQLLHLLSENNADYFVIQSGMVGKSSLPSHKDFYSVEKTNYELGAAELISVPMVWQDDSGIRVTKKYVFSKDSYVIDQKYEVENASADIWSGSIYSQIKRGEPADGGSRFIYTYTGAVLSEPENPYEKISFDNIKDENLKADIAGGWAAMIQHYFIAALIPPDKDPSYRYYTLNPESNRYVIGSVSPVKQAKPGQVISLSERLYVGPKIQERLEAVTENLVLTVDYGWFWFIAKPLFWVLDTVHNYVNNWGWAIILLTILIKLVFYPLSAAGYRSMANMRRVQPKMMSIRDRYKDDKARLNQAMMDLYKTEKINPLGGCFPILIQIPVFIALYWVLLESVEMRQAEFILWLDNLSAPDPFFILPLVMGLTMFIQQKLNPAPMDPVQEKVMSFLPIVFTVFFAFFPAGLVLYWVANNILSIAQQARINHTLEKAGLK